MKKVLLASAFFLLGTMAYSQCTPDHDFGGAAYGVSPDPEQGETFADGSLGVAYEDVLHLIVPTDAGEVAPEFAGLPIDSVQVQSVSLVLDGTTYTPEQVGLAYACNNNDVSPDPCTILGGQQGCAAIFGVPNTAGTFSIVVVVNLYTTLFGNVVSQPVTFDQFTLFIDSTIDVQDATAINFAVGQNKPNPFSKNSTVEFNLNSNGVVNFSVMNLLGDVVHQESMNGVRGKNTLRMNASDYQPGVYLYRLEFEGQIATYRMVVSR